MHPVITAALLFAAQDAAPAPLETSSVETFSIEGAGAEQLVLVVTPSWQSPQGALKRFEKVGARWMQVGGTLEVVVGDAGLGWGLGLHPLGVGEPRKMDGDSRAPAGVFRLPTALTRVPMENAGAMPFIPVAGTVCIEEPRGDAYNRMLTAEHAPAVGGTPLDRPDGRYDLAVVVDHNGLGALEQTPRKGRGACTFLHVWRRKGRGTDGGTAMAREDLEKVVRWLDPRKKPVLVQLPKAELAAKRGLWGLP